jgi:methionyl-tRNA synthetase
VSEQILVGVAWPYANGPLHLGHIAGAYLPADVFARYQRIAGNRVLMVSGSDQHGTPITIRAEQEGLTPKQVADKYHGEFIDCWRKLGISFDIFTHTETANHAKVTHDIFSTLLQKGHIYKGKMSQPFCPSCRRFLPDRYVEGTCPSCGSPKARGDQCEDCGKALNPEDLLELRCKICSTKPHFRDSEHFFLRLSSFRDQLLAWVKQQSHWRPNVLNFTLRYLEEGLKDRAITRDMEWGIPVPVSGFEKKRIYVWFEAVIGYLSASKEWALRQGEPESWRPFWWGKGKSYYFIGKDNIPFHTMIWPAMLMGYGGLNLPYDVPANEFLSIDGKKLSTSRNWAVWLPDYLQRYDPDPLRYFLSANMPETADADFSWRELYRRNNDELVATYGNLVHRVLTFCQRHFAGQVPEGRPDDPSSQMLIQKAQAAFDTVGTHINACRFREAIKDAFGLAQEANRYLEEKSPWKTQKNHDSSTAIYTSLVTISALKTQLYPFLPFSSAKLHRLLGFTGNLESDGWKLRFPTPGQALPLPEPLFIKLDEKLVPEESMKIGSSNLS